MAVNDNLRFQAVLDAYVCAVQRIKFTADNGGNLKSILRECESVESFAEEIGAASSDAEVEALVGRRNSI